MEERVRNSMELGRAIRDTRETAGLTQEQLGKKAFVSRRWLVRVEQGHDTAEVGKVIDVLRALGLDFALVPRPHVKEPTLAEVLGEDWA